MERGGARAGWRGVDPGLCGACRHERVVETRSGSRFHMCLRSRVDPKYARYPHLPVLRCPGFEPRRSTEDDGTHQPEAV